MAKWKYKKKGGTELEKLASTKVDMVNHPPHYTAGKYEVIDVMEDKMDSEQFLGYCLGNVLKYAMRAGKKGNRAEDLAKMSWYATRAAQMAQILEG